MQIILVDDGSTDNSGSICDEYALKDGRIQVIHKPNGGLVSARKAGLKLATGEYISNVDSDDWLELNMYEEMLENILETNADFVNTGFIHEKDGISEIRCEIETCVIKNPKYNVDLWKSFMYLHKTWNFNSYLWSKLFKKDIIISCYNNLPDDRNFGEDRIAITECLLRCERVSILKKAYYHYLSREGNYTSVHGAKGIFWAVNMYEEMFKLFNKYGVYKILKPCFETALYIRIMNEMDMSCAGIEKDNIFKLNDLENFNGKKIIIYGAGKVGYHYYRQLCAYPNFKIVDWVDKNFSKYNYKERNVSPVENIKLIDYDLILVAIKDKKVADNIIDDLLSMNIERDKIYWHEPIKIKSWHLSEDMATSNEFHLSEDN